MRGSLIITANHSFGEWGKVFQDPAMTLATVDRLVHHPTIFEMKLGSYRRRTAIVAGPDSAPMARSTSASSATSASLYQRANGRRATGRALVLDQRLHSVPA